MNNKVIIVAPSNTMADLPSSLRQVGINRLKSLGFEPVFSKYSSGKYLHMSGTRAQRIHDLKEALIDPKVCGVMAVFGGYNTNELLDHIEELKSDTSKWVIGYSDVTALLLALADRQNINVIHGPGFASFCDPNFFDFSLSMFIAAISGYEIKYTNPGYFASDLWYLKDNYGPRDVITTDGCISYKTGTVVAPIIGGNIDTICALIGTPYFPKLKDKLLFVESTIEHPGHFHRALIQLKQVGVLDEIAGLIIGKAVKNSPLCNTEYLIELLNTINLPQYPMLLDVHCSHVDPMLSIPINTKAKLSVNNSPTLILNYRG